MNFFPADRVSTFLPDKWCSSIEILFDLDLEANIPTWFSTLLLFSIALVSFIIYNLDQNTKTESSWRFFWLGFSIVFCFLSMDEASGLHEIITSGFGIKWIWIYAPLGVLFFIFCSYYLENVFKKKKLTDFILGGLAIYALGITTSEYISYYINLGKAEAALEEGFEMFGTIMVLAGCLNELNNLLRLKWDNIDTI